MNLPNPIALLPSALATLVALGAALPAQAPDHLVGITRFTPFLRHYSPQNCAPIGQCPLPGLPGSGALPPFVGGTGWDPVRPGAWVSNGLLLAKYDDNCAVQCPPMPVPTLGAAAFVTGIEVVEGLNQLWLIDSLGMLHSYTNTCPPNPIGVCNTGLGPNAIGQVTSGLAVDEGSGFAFVSYPAFPFGVNTIAVIPLFAPCAPTGFVQVPPCPTTPAGLGPITGLACDWGSQILYATDGNNTVALDYVPGAVTIGIVGVTCCPAIAVAEPLIGLAVRPGRATSHGLPCANGGCAPCPMNHTLLNDPLLGNAQFRLGLASAQPNVFAFCLIGGGPCTNVGVVTPPLCGPIWTVPYLGYLGVNATGGGFAVCDGATTFNLPLPVNPALANQVFSSQCLTICFTAAGFGTSLSNCLSWRLQGS